MALIDTGVYVDGVRGAQGLSPAEAIGLARERNGFAWIGLRDTDAEELGGVQQLLDLSPLAVRECLHGHQRGKLQRFGEMTFIVLHPTRYHDEREEVSVTEADIFVGADYIVTVQDDDSVDVGEVRERLEAHPEVLERGPYAVVWAMFEWVVAGTHGVLQGVENDIDEIEEQLFSNDADVSRRIFALQREVITLQHATAPMVDILERMQKLVIAATGRPDAPAFAEVESRARLVADRVDGFRRTLESALSVHATLVEQENNEAMRKMTEFGLEQNEQVKKVSGWAAILFAPTLVGTVYGMNFDIMPELHWAWGYPAALGLMVATSVTLYLVFRGRGWL